MNKINNIETFNSNEAWQKLHSRLLDDDLIPEKKVFFRRENFMRIAAFLLLAISLTAISIYYLQNYRSTQFTIVETSDKQEINEVKLSDGSVVYMNKDSKLKFPKEFEANKRVIEFEGEAFFDIARNTSKPFIIKVNNAEVKVLGTSFNINTHLAQSEIEVIVTTGKVQVSRKAQKVFIEPGYKALVNNHSVTKNQNNNKNYLSWKTKQFDFRNVELHQVLSDLNKAYNVKISLKEKSLNNNKLRTKFNNESLDFILKVIAETYNLKIQKQENKFTLSKK